jgi:hypothetical protein
MTINPWSPRCYWLESLYTLIPGSYDLRDKILVGFLVWSPGGQKGIGPGFLIWPRISYIYSTFYPDTDFVARSIHQMTQVINYQNQDWYSFPMNTFLMKNRSCANPLLRDDTQFYFYCLLSILLYCLLRGRGQECISSCRRNYVMVLDTRPTWHLLITHDATGREMPWSRVIHGNSFIMKESIKSNDVSLISWVSRGWNSENWITFCRHI